MPIRTARDVVDAELQGRVREYAWNKTNASMYQTAGIWADFSGASGNPKAKQWFDATPLAAQQIRQSTDGGIWHGANVSPYTKYLRSMRVQPITAVTPYTLTLCDYLLYYPTVEDASTDPQVMDNTQTLPRYADGAGVQMMAVTISSRTGGQTFSVTYTNQDGVAGRVTPNVTQNAIAWPGSITTASLAANSGGNPFIPLQGSDTGVRLVESVTMNGADTGFFAIVLVRPLATMTLQNVVVPYEKDFLLGASEMPIIQDDAYLSCLMFTAGTSTAVTLRGSLRCIWG